MDSGGEAEDGGGAVAAGAAPPPPHNSAALVAAAAAAAEPAPMDADGADAGMVAAAPALSPGGGSMGDGEDGGEAVDGPHKTNGEAAAVPGVTATPTSPASPASSLPAVDPDWAHLAATPTDAVIVMRVFGEMEDDSSPTPSASVCGRRARLGWEVRGGGPGAAAFPARPLPACPASAARVALYGGGGDPVEEDELYSLESAPCLRVRLHETRLRSSARMAAEMDKAGAPCLKLDVPRGLTRAALTLLRALYEAAALPPATDGGSQLLLTDVLHLAQGWGFVGVEIACEARFSKTTPPGGLVWPVATRLAAMAAVGGSGGMRAGDGARAAAGAEAMMAAFAAAGKSVVRPGAGPSSSQGPRYMPLFAFLQSQAMATAAVGFTDAGESGPPSSACSPASCSPTCLDLDSSPSRSPHHHALLRPLLPVGLDLDFVLDSPSLRAVWVDLPPQAVLRLLGDPRSAAGCENSAIAAAAVWLAGGWGPDDGGPEPYRPASTTTLHPSARAAWAPLLATVLRPERATPLYAAALPTFAPWALGVGGGGGGGNGGQQASSQDWAAAAAPRAAGLVRPPSTMSYLDMEFSADVAAVAGLVAGGSRGAAPHPPPPPSSAPRFFRGLFWRLSVEPCQSDPSKAGMFLHATYPPAAPGLVAAVNAGRASAVAAAGGAEVAGLLPPPGARPPAGAAWVITQRPASASVAPLRLAMASVWPATTSYGLAGIRGMSGDTGSAGAWVKGGRLRFSVHVSEVL